MLCYQRDGEIMITQEDRAVWRLFFRGAGCYTRAFPAWYTLADVKARLGNEGQIADLITAEQVT